MRQSKTESPSQQLGPQAPQPKASVHLLCLKNSKRTSVACEREGVVENEVRNVKFLKKNFFKVKIRARLHSALSTIVKRTFG